MQRTFKIESLYLALGAFSLLGLLLCQVYQQVPFLQHEMNHFIYFWTEPRETFLKLIFDPLKMDGFPGRFRYVEYLIHGAYWNLMAAGILPRDFYDLSAILVTILCTPFIIFICRKKKLNLYETLLFLGIFLLSSQTFLSIVIHFRKAKFLVSLWLLLMVWASQRDWIKVHSRRYFLWGLMVVGVLTDPFFIIFSPGLAWALDRSAGRKFVILKETILGLVLGGLAVILLNGVIGPLFNPASSVVLRGIEGIPVTLFKFKNLFYFPYVLTDLLTPGLLGEKRQILSWGVWGTGLISVIWMGRKAGLRSIAFCLCFLFSLLLAAFCIDPSHMPAVFTGYYGHPLMLLFLFAQLEVFLFLKGRDLKRLQWAQCVFLLGVVILHQLGKTPSYTYWVNGLSGSPRDKEKVYTDYNELRKIARYMESNPTTPYVLHSDVRKLTKVALLKGRYDDNKGQLNRTDIAYIFIPAAFKREFDAGLLRIQME